MILYLMDSKFIYSYIISLFYIISSGILTLEEGPNLFKINNKTADPNGPKAMIGAGTGMGHGYLVKTGKYYEVFPSEGGHADFAPQSDLEWEYFKYVQ